MTSYKLDLHTHSQLSIDGGLSAQDYKWALDMGLLDFIAVTDHNAIDFARELQKELGEQIIVGEEIKTKEGELIGLFLQETIPAHLSVEETVKQIKKQGGLVCAPHPFETVRSGVALKTLDRIAKDVDIIEVHNGRAVFQNKSEAAKEWAVRHEVAGTASSDAHTRSGWGRTYSIITAKPRPDNLVALLHQATYECRWPGLKGIAAPKANRLKKRLARMFG